MRYSLALFSTCFAFLVPGLFGQTDLELTGGYNVSDPSELLVPVGGRLTLIAIISNETSEAAAGDIRLEVDGNGDYYIVSTTATNGGSGNFGLKDATAEWTEINGNQTAEFVFTIVVDGPTSGDITATLIYAADTNPDNNEVVLPLTVDAPQGSLSGTVWDDVNRNGVYDDEELVLQSWAVFLDFDLDGELDEDEPVQFTDLLGFYQFTGLAPELYRVTLVEKADWTRSFPDKVYHDVTVVADTDAGDNDFGVYFNGSVEISFFHDRNRNGIRDEGELDAILDQTISPSAGIYVDDGGMPISDFIDGLSQGSHTIRVTSPDVIITTGEQTVILSEEVPHQGIEVGLVRLYPLTVRVLHVDTDSKKKAVEKLIKARIRISKFLKNSVWPAAPGMRVIVRDGDGQVVAETPPDGTGLRKSLPEGTYSVELILREGFRYLWSLGDGLNLGTLEGVTVVPAEEESTNRVVFTVEVLPPEVEVTESGLQVEANPGLTLERSTDGVLWIEVPADDVHPETKALFFRQTAD